MKLLKKIDENLLKGLLTLFIFFIPLYPKFPFKGVTFTYIAIRLDDLLIALITGVFLIQLARKKIDLSRLKFKKPIFIFWLLVFASYLSGLYITQTIDYPYVGFLHTARRVEYMIVFFIATAAIRSVRDFKYYMYALVGSIFLVSVYGAGQRLAGFPAIQTMNPEFAKGRLLFLTPEARLSSTFAGHYDLGAYLVFFFPILWGLLIYLNAFAATVKERAFLIFSALVPFILMIYSLGASVYEGNVIAIFFISFFNPMQLMIFATIFIGAVLYLFVHGRLEKWFMFFLIILAVGVLVATASRTSSIAYFVSISAYLLYFRKFRYFLFIMIISLALTFKDDDLINRWLKTVQIKQILINEETGEEIVVQKIKPEELPAGTAFIKAKPSTDSTDSALLKEELVHRATMSGKTQNTDDYQTVTAVAADISIATRFQVSWPRAINAFKQNPLLGTGPSSITESSDGDYVRWLGELGALGTAAFLYVIGAIMKFLFDARKRISKRSQAVILAALFGTMGLFVNALLIDVFEASKVAYMFWATLGLFVGVTTLQKKELEKL